MPKNWLPIINYSDGILAYRDDPSPETLESYLKFEFPNHDALFRFLVGALAQIAEEYDRRFVIVLNREWANIGLRDPENGNKFRYMTVRFAPETHATIFNSYTCVRSLGHGSYGEVFECSGGIAIKFQLHQNSFNNEFDVLSHLAPDEFTHIVKPLYFSISPLGSPDDYFRIQYFTMEYLTPPPPPNAFRGYAEPINILIGIAEGLKVLHAHGFVYSDLSLQNVMMRGNDSVLIDFGLVHTIGQEYRLESYCDYASPKIKQWVDCGCHQPFPRLTIADDCWQFGRLCVSMLVPMEKHGVERKKSIWTIIDRLLVRDEDRRASLDEFIVAAKGE